MHFRWCRGKCNQSPDRQKAPKQESKEMHEGSGGQEKTWVLMGRLVCALGSLTLFIEMEEWLNQMGTQMCPQPRGGGGVNWKDRSKPGFWKTSFPFLCLHINGTLSCHLFPFSQFLHAFLFFLQNYFKHTSSLKLSLPFWIRRWFKGKGLKFQVHVVWTLAQTPPWRLVPVELPVLTPWNFTSMFAKLWK